MVENEYNKSMFALCTGLVGLYIQRKIEKSHQYIKIFVDTQYIIYRFNFMKLP